MSEHPLPVKQEIFDRYKDGAKNPEKFERMIRMVGEGAETKADMEKMIMMFFATDMSYHRADICLAMKVIEKDRGW
jgi:uncharacterized damage-inducible protein DinB